MIRRPPRSTLFPTRRSSDLYVMPYVEGESLRDRLTREKQLPQDDALRIATEVAVHDPMAVRDRKSTRLNSSHLVISYAVFCLKKKKKNTNSSSISSRSIIST